jgi:predicted metal-dependent hydrolase
MESFKVAEITVNVTFKEIKNIHLSVHPPYGEVTLSAPPKYDLDTLRLYVVSRIDWLRERIIKFQKQERIPARKFINNETHFFLGQRYKLFLNETQGKQYIEKIVDRLIMHLRSKSDKNKRAAIMESWHRKELKIITKKFVEKWEPKLSVKVRAFGIKKMKTKWGTCNPETGRIWMNLELAKMPENCIEYIIVHEMVHLLEKTHNKRFFALLDHYMPGWQIHRDKLNNLPLSDEITNSYIKIK